MKIENLVTSIAGKTGLTQKRQTRQPTVGMCNYLPDLDENSEPEEQREQQLAWIKSHKREIRSRHNIIQREMHLGAQLLHYDNLEDQGLESSQSTAHQLQVEECNQKLKALGEEFIALSKQITELEKGKPPSQLVRDYLKRQHNHTRTLWKLERIFCQLRGGCCARDCGCCDRSWRTIRDHSARIHYSHCSRDCRCCVRYRALVASKRRSSSETGSPTMSPTRGPTSDAVDIKAS